MEKRKQQPHALQWHPAFYAGIQIELEAEADLLLFENEQQLGTKPKEIDVLIVKKERDVSIRKNIGRIFRTHNIVEYKSPKDYLSVDDFYKVYGYTCFYKADTAQADSIAIHDITITFVCHRYPRSLMRHLTEERGYEIHREEDGIYYITGDNIPIQLILTKELSEEQNLWLKSLTDELEETETAKHLIEQYGKHKGNNLYKSVMDLIVRANKDKFKEAKIMCEALEELFMEIMPDRVQKLMDEAQKARDEETAQKIEENAVQINKLTAVLLEEGRIDDIKRASEDRNYQKKLLKEFGLLSEKV